MKRLISIAILAFVSINVLAQNDVNMGIIPAPVSVKKKTGSFKLDKTVVLIAADPNHAAIADLLNASIVTKGGFALREAKSAAAGGKSIVLTSEGADALPAEGYTIDITDKKITLKGKPAGLFYAVQSMIQLLPEKQNNGMSIQAAEITDYPRFKYRGMHLDVCRHMFPVSFIKKYIDLMAQYKLNNFHWHLTDDQGWRIEIKKYPKLTAAGASRNGTIIGHHPGIGTDNTVYSGFYTQNEAKEVVAYAASKFINVIPEIELPGHSSAAIAAYPELSCFPERDTFVEEKAPWAGSRKGKQVQQTWGVFSDVFVPTENTFTFLENVLDEVIAIFPSKYIHIGGDESPKEYWKESEFCQKLIKQLGIKDEHELQSYFIQRIEKHVNSKGRSIIGWDEILEGGLAPNATVMSWRGTEGGIAAAQQNHDVIMTPGGNIGLYFDHKQSNSPDEPMTIGGLSPYSLVYAYDPIPKELTPEQQKHVIGVQANMWTEYIQTPAKAEYMVLPRMLSLSEISWSQVANKDFKNFSEARVPVHLARLDKSNINYWVPVPLGTSNQELKGENFSYALKAPVTGAKIYYTLDLTRPSETATLYKDPIRIVVPAGQKRTLKTIVITPAGRRSVVTETVFNNGAPDIKTK
ncbi:beta-N-acetylhexosaminidase [Pedobacter metabolipauper]|uniref:beta-N-acetylhexosaminidase n=1 Tax=Pedobacter metabolipauper TaxID=425513 RepID=A0A4R6SRR7_9SPHI|nr:family 20 glycosylhydrolase [Pedobacter metabolipauper]TDQ06405.1 hexosaminidase [Pedobacter metabolipauper]